MQATTTPASRLAGDPGQGWGIRSRSEGWGDLVANPLSSPPIPLDNPFVSVKPGITKVMENRGQGSGHRDPEAAVWSEIRTAPPPANPAGIHRSRQARRRPRSRMGHPSSFWPEGRPPGRQSPHASQRKACVGHAGLVVVLEAQVGDEVFAHDVAQRVLQLHRLDEEVVFRIQAGGALGALEEEAEPLLNAEVP
jgi:hypothetical protein